MAREQTIQELLRLQRGDGSWNLPSLGDWKRRDGTPNNPRAAGDGYATGLVLYVLRQAGTPATADPIRRGVRWLQSNQRASGRWFTRSINADRAHYLTNAGTAYAVMALQACAEKEPAGQAGEPVTSVELFNGKDLSGWKFRGGDRAAATSKWSVVGSVGLGPRMPGRLLGHPGMGILLSGDDGRGVDLLSELAHGDCELHVEFTVARGSNSGVYFQGQYEVQILDSFGKPDKSLQYGDCGGIYNTAPPRTNASKAPGEWQSFDVVFHAPRFDDQGKKIGSAKFVKVVHNGVVIHENVEVKGPTTAALGGPERPLGPLMLQGDHGPVAYRNLRLKKLGRP